MNRAGIDFYSDLNVPGSTYIRYFLKTENRESIDSIIRENQIIAHTETIPTVDYPEQQKFYQVVFFVAVILMLIVVILLLFH